MTLDISQVCHSIRGCIDEVLDYMPDKSIFVESGCYKGTTSYYFIKRLLMTNKGFQYWCIDNWELVNISDNSGKPEIDNFEFFQKTVEEVQPHINIISSDSIEAIDQFQNDSVYFTFLDDCHTYEHVTKQIGLWIPKMKDHSILAGDDFYSGDVKRAVYDHFDEKDVVKIDNCGFMVKDPKSKVKNERYR